MKETMFVCWRKGYRLNKIREEIPALTDTALLELFRTVVQEYFECGSVADKKQATLS